MGSSLKFLKFSTGILAFLFVLIFILLNNFNPSYIDPKEGRKDALKVKISDLMEYFKNHCERYPSEEEGVNQFFQGNKEIVSCFSNVPEELKISNHLSPKDSSGKLITDYVYKLNENEQRYLIEYVQNGEVIKIEGGTR